MATGWDLALLLGILIGSAFLLLAGAVGLGQYLRLRRRRGSVEPGPTWLSGTARPADGAEVTAPVSGESALCVAWALEREGGRVARRVWRTVETGRREVPFVLETAAGPVRTDPANASLDLVEDHAETFDDHTALREAMPASSADVSLDDQTDRYRLTEHRIAAGDVVDASGTLGTSPDDPPTLSGPADTSIPRRLLGVPFVLADSDRDGGAGLLRDRALAGFVLGLPPALLALVLLFPP
jgi:hypothetical protein